MAELFERPTILAISLWQPWAILWLTNAKPDETRHWPFPTGYRGERVLVHAAKKRVPRDLEDDDLEEICERILGGVGWRERIAYGAFLGSLTLARATRIETWETGLPGGPEHSDDAVCGDWAPGRWAWRRERPRIFDRPIPAKGQQGFWRVSRDLLANPAPNDPHPGGEDETA